MKATTKHQLIAELDEPRYTLRHLVDLSQPEKIVLNDLEELILKVRDLPVEGG